VLLYKKPKLLLKKITLLFCISILRIVSANNDTLIIKQNIDKALNTQNKTEALKLIEDVKILAQNQSNLKWSAELLIVRGIIYYSNNEYYKALTAYKEALMYCEQYKLDKKKAIVLLNISVVYRTFGEHQKSYAYALEALNIHKKLGNDLGMAKALKEMADGIYSEYNRTEKNFKIALSHYSEAIEIFKRKKEYEDWVAALNNCAVLYMQAEKVEEGRRMLNMAEELYEAHKEKIETDIANDVKVNMLCNKGWIYLVGLKKYDSAIIYINEAILYCKTNGNFTHTLSRNYLNLTIAYKRLKQYDLARKNCVESINYAIKAHDIYTQAECYLNLCKFDSINGDYQSTYANFKTYTLLRDSIGKNEKLMQLEKINIQFETEKVEQENKDLIDKNTARTRIIIVLGLLVLAVIALFYFYFKSRKVESALLEEKAVNLENEKKMILLDKFLEEEKNKILAEENESQNREITSKNISLEQNKNVLESAYEDLRHLNKNLTDEDQELVAKLKSSIKSNLSFTDEWQSTALHFEKVHPNFFKHLHSLNKSLTQNDLRHCAYMKLNLSTKEIAWILNIDSNSVRTNRYRIKKKLGLEESTDLILYIASV
jgi:tetratricopeptide (TPR) repeat protein